jgi:hypothetical protein
VVVGTIVELVGAEEMDEVEDGTATPLLVPLSPLVDETGVKLLAGEYVEGAGVWPESINTTWVGAAR